ncbi:DEAD/DEAH box helicase [Haematomicrobium sanguinis]|uniref:DEAD/DEAH box helicase n=1 Tax=Haematomicrobium sanguinis TaxID=479106 RepID=UPI00047C0E46|nr:DEAD/DEAH box helicase [Haematomicrobium sanguinis]
MALAQELVADVWASDYFLELLDLLEREVAQAFVRQPPPEGLSQAEVNDLLRFADLLSFSDAAEDRNMAYRIVAQVSQLHTIDFELRAYGTAILSKLGNFPGLDHLRELCGGLPVLPIEREVERQAKLHTQRTSDGNLVFTDAQYEIRRALATPGFFSFSGPTSIGKSFILKDYIKSLLAKDELAGSAIVVLVPTRALITQLVDDFRREITDSRVHVGAFPQTSPLLQRQFDRSVLVLTPERLIRYLSSGRLPVRYLFVDEAQKIAAVKDERSSLYYHAIYETTRRYATQLVFASPNIPNPGIFLEIFGHLGEQSLSVQDRTVSQNRYYVNPHTQRASYFKASLSGGPLEEHELEHQLPGTVNGLLATLGARAANLVYCNSTGATVELARAFALSRPLVTLTPTLESLIEFASTSVHVDYYLITCLRHGVAFHHGRMPYEVRARIEAIFLDGSGPLDFIFCTSTLLEGVNLPAKNIFVLTEKHGSAPFEQVDFENLVGRAGRLTREFSGNVICVPINESSWTDKTLMTTTMASEAVSFLVDKNKRRTSEFNNIGRVLAGEEITSGFTVGARSNFATFGSLIFLHHLENNGSPLVTKFLEKNRSGEELLAAVVASTRVPAAVVRTSPSIKLKYQQRALEYIETYCERSQFFPDSEQIEIQPMLRLLYDLYNWEKEESGGRNPLIPPGLIRAGYGTSQLNYWAMVANHWIKAEPLSRIINYSIHFHQNRGYIWFKLNGRVTREDFVRSPRHINIIIEQVMTDIENGLRHKIFRYLQNFFDLSRHVLGDAAAPNWAELIEYGTTDRRSVSLQNSGFSRSAAKLIIDEYIGLVSFNARHELVEIDIDALHKVLPEGNEITDEIRAVIVGFAEPTSP